MLGSFGYLKLIVEGAELQGFGKGSSRAKIIVSGEEYKTDRPVSILKTTCVDNDTSDPIWDEFINMRCCPGWTVDIEVLVTHQQGSILFITEQLVVGSGTGGSMMLYQNGQETNNFVNVLVEFFPNHSDMYCLSRDCILESYLPKLLAEELLQTASNSLAAKEEKGESVTGQLQSLEKSFRRLLSSINSDALRSLLSKHLHEAMGDDVGSISSAIVSNARTSPPLLAADYTLTAPDEIETFRAIACARQFLRYILKDFKKQCIPEPTAGLVEKLLSLYLASAQDIINERDSLRSPSSATQIDEIITFSLFVDFVLVASVWYLQLAFTYVNICEECKISPVEVNAIWARFEIYDPSFSGYIMASDLFLLLQDMGETYTREEMVLILAAVDSVGIGIVELPALIHWWCTE